MPATIADCCDTFELGIEVQLEARGGRHVVVSVTRLHRIVKWHAYWAAKTLSRHGRERTMSLAAVALLHVFLLFVVVWGSSHTPAQPAPRDLQAAIFRNENPHPPRIDAPEVALPVAEPPEIVIESDQSREPIVTASATIVLPPRPDPTRPNDQPMAPTPGTAPIVVLRILVSPDGLVTDAKVVPPLSRDPSANDAALAWVEAHWHFIPAMLGAVPVQYWTTVSVRFTAAR